jgi:hypothetical protein
MIQQGRDLVLLVTLLESSALVAAQPGLVLLHPVRLSVSRADTPADLAVVRMQPASQRCLSVKEILAAKAQRQVFLAVAVVPARVLVLQQPALGAVPAEQGKSLQLLV